MRLLKLCEAFHAEHTFICDRVVGSVICFPTTIVDHAGDRRDYGLTWNAALEAGGFVVGDDVKVSIDVEFTAA